MPVGCHAGSGLGGTEQKLCRNFLVRDQRGLWCRGWVGRRDASVRGVKGLLAAAFPCAGGGLGQPRRREGGESSQPHVLEILQKKGWRVGSAQVGGQVLLYLSSSAFLKHWTPFSFQVNETLSLLCLCFCQPSWIVVLGTSSMPCACLWSCSAPTLRWAGLYYKIMAVKTVGSWTC